MDANSYVNGALGVVVILAAFYAYVRTQFLSKDVADVQYSNLKEQLNSIQVDIRAIHDLAIVKSTIDELADKMIDIYSNRIPIQRQN